MEGSTEEGSVRDAAGERIVDLADGHGASTELDTQAGTKRTPAGLDVRRFDHPVGVVLTLGGELDLTTVPVLQERLDRAIRDGAAVIIDLSRLRFVDSSGLRMLVRSERRLRGAGGRLVLVRGSHAVHRIFEFTSLDSHFEFCDSQSAALRAVLVGRIEARRIPKPARTDTTRKSPTAACEE